MKQWRQHIHTIKNHFLEHWPVYGLIGFALFGLAITIITFYPGRLYTDSVYQLLQAKKESQLDTWHPISMVLVWQAFINLMHGNYSGLLLLQLFLMWGGLLVSSLVVYKNTKNKKLPFLILAIGLLPYIINLIGFVVKDIQMASSLLMATALLTYIKYIKPSKNLRWIFSILISLLLIYAISVRVNGIVATLPLLILLASLLVSPKSKRRRLTITLIVVCFMVISLFVINILNKITDATVSSSTVTMYILDINNLQDKNSILQKAPPEVREQLVAFEGCSLRNNAKTNLNVWECMPDPINMKELIILSTSPHLKTTQRYWLSVILSNPLGYIAQKTETYTQFLLNTNSIWLDHDANEAITHKDAPRPGQKYIIQKSANSIIKNYVENFGDEYFGFIYKAWFWLVASILLIVYSKRLNRYKAIVTTLAFSALLNILSYAPGSITPGYRFFYWSALASTLAFVLLIIDIRQRSA